MIAVVICFTLLETCLVLAEAYLKEIGYGACVQRWRAGILARVCRLAPGGAWLFYEHRALTAVDADTLNRQRLFSAISRGLLRSAAAVSDFGCSACYGPPLPGFWGLRPDGDAAADERARYAARSAASIRRFAAVLAAATRNYAAVGDVRADDRCAGDGGAAGGLSEQRAARSKRRGGRPCGSLIVISSQR